MKKIFIATNIMWLCIIGLMAFNQKGNNSNVKESTFSDSCINKICSGFSNPGNELNGQISSDLASQISRDYANDLGKKYIWNNSNRSRKEDALSIVFDLETLKKYIYYIESNVCTKGCLSNKLQLGIRFYYSKYPDSITMKNNEYLKDLDPSYANRHTLFLVPAYRYLFSKSVFRNFNPLTITSDCRFHWDGDGVPFPTPVKIILGPSGAESEQNHGSLRPPPAGTGIFPESEN